MTIPANVQKLENVLINMENLIQQQKNTLQQSEAEFKKMKRYASSLIESIKKSSEKQPRKPSGFALPVVVSDELCEFLQIPSGSQVSRTDVTKHMIAYITENGLAHPEKKTRIVPDAQLAALLGENVELETLTRFTIQKYMNRHFCK
jgi:chromatin remodeling complex protein RSC6